MKTETQFSNLYNLQAYFSSEEVCREHLEKFRWNGTVVCPFCNSDKVYKFSDKKTYKCANKECNKKFNATVGTIFENTKLPLSKWFIAMYLITNHKKGISSLQLSRDLSITQRSAWFVNHRIRTMLKGKSPAMLTGIVEADETYVGGKEHNKHKSTRGERLVNGVIPKFGGSKGMVFGLVERDGKIINQVIPATTSENILPIIQKQVQEGSHITTDDLPLYKGVANIGYAHSFVRHGRREYVVGNSHTCTIDGYWSLLKRGIIGIYHSTSKKHLHRYCDEFTFRYNTRNFSESDRFNEVLSQCAGRLKYKNLVGKNAK